MPQARLHQLHCDDAIFTKINHLCFTELKHLCIPYIIRFLFMSIVELKHCELNCVNLHVAILIGRAHLLMCTSRHFGVQCCNVLSIWRLCRQPIITTTSLCVVPHCLAIATPSLGTVVVILVRRSSSPWSGHSSLRIQYWACRSKNRRNRRPNPPAQSKHCFKTTNKYKQKHYVKRKDPHKTKERNTLCEQQREEVCKIEKKVWDNPAIVVEQTSEVNVLLTLVCSE